MRLGHVNDAYRNQLPLFSIKYNRSISFPYHPSYVCELQGSDKEVLEAMVISNSDMESSTNAGRKHYKPFLAMLLDLRRSCHGDVSL